MTSVSEPISWAQQPLKWDHSSYIVDFVRTISQNENIKAQGPDEEHVLSSLECLSESLAAASTPQPAPVHLSLTNHLERSIKKSRLPPLEVVVRILKWAKGLISKFCQLRDSFTKPLITDNLDYFRICFITRIYPLDKIEEMCKSIYFQSESCNEVDLILVNGYLSYLLCECFFTNGSQEFRAFSELTRTNFETAISQLPLLLPQSMEMAAVLTLGVRFSTFLLLVPHLCPLLSCMSTNRILGFQ